MSSTLYRVEMASEYDADGEITAWKVASKIGPEMNPGAAVDMTSFDAQNLAADWRDRNCYCRVVEQYPGQSNVRTVFVE